MDIAQLDKFVIYCAGLKVSKNAGWKVGPQNKVQTSTGNNRSVETQRAQSGRRGLSYQNQVAVLRSGPFSKAPRRSW